MQLLLDTQRRSVVVAPEAQHFHPLLIRFNAVDEAMLDVDASGVGPSQVNYQPRSSLIASAGVAIPSRIESRMPGIEVR